MVRKTAASGKAVSLIISLFCRKGILMGVAGFGAKPVCRLYSLNSLYVISCFPCSLPTGPTGQLTGFDTIFTFQVSDHSRTCSDHVNPNFSLNLYRSCAVHGGDGFAFVIHGDPRNVSAIGGDGQDLGYGGISNSLAVEFDMWTNVDTQGSDDIFFDHVSIHSDSVRPNSSNASTALGYWRQTNLADGKIHSARIQYLPYVETKYFELMTANDNLLPYLKDNGEGRRLGTLAVFVDDGIADDKPLLAIPINLSILLHLPESLAYAGFTASTGMKWEKHDILSWHWCDTNCRRGDIEEMLRSEAKMDHATSNKLHYS